MTSQTTDNFYVLFLDFRAAELEANPPSHENLTSGVQNVYDETIGALESFPFNRLRVTKSLHDFEEKLNQIDLGDVPIEGDSDTEQDSETPSYPSPKYVVGVVWLTRATQDKWRDVQRVFEDGLNTSLIVIFGFEDTIPSTFSDICSQAMQRGAFPFAYPFNPNVLRAYIEAERIKLIRQGRLHETLLDELAEVQSVHTDPTIGAKILNFLKADPLVGYSRATITLIDTENNEDRYLLLHDPHTPQADTTFFIRVSEDRLIQEVFKSDYGVLVLGDLPKHRQKYFEIILKIREWVEELNRVINSTTRTGNLPSQIVQILWQLISIKPTQQELLEKAQELLEKAIELEATLRLNISIDERNRLAYLSHLDNETTIGTLLQTILEIVGLLKSDTLSEDEKQGLEEYERAVLDTKRSYDDLKKIAWQDRDATRDINSWVGIGLSLGRRRIGVITLDHYEQGHYSQHGENLLTYLQEFAYYTSEFIQNYFKERNDETLETIFNSITDLLDPVAIIQKMVSGLEKTLECDRVTYLRVESSQDISAPKRILRKWVPVNKSKRGRFSFAIGEGIAGTALRGGSIIVPNALANDAFVPSKSLSGANLSMLAVPIKIGDRVVGVISCYTRNFPHFFTPYDRDLVSMVAKQGAPLIERNRILDSTNSINRKINARFGRTGSLNKLLFTICKYAVEITGATNGTIHMLRDEREMQPTTRYNFYKKMRERKPMWRRKGLLWRKPIQGELKHVRTQRYPRTQQQKHRRPRLDGTGATDQLFTRRYLGKVVQYSPSRPALYQRLHQEMRDDNVKSVIGIGLIVRDAQGRARAVGALFLSQYADLDNSTDMTDMTERNNPSFSKVDKFLLRLFAQQAAIAISNYTAFQERRVWADANNGLAEATRAITATENLDKMYHSIVSQSSRLVNAEHAYLALIHNGSRLRFVAAQPHMLLRDLQEEVVEFDYEMGNPKHRDKRGITGLAAKGKEVIRIDDIRQEQAKRTLLWKEYIDFGKGTRSELAVPIFDALDENKVIGVINLESSARNAFTATHEQVITHIARHVAIAIQKNDYIRRIESERDKIEKLQRTLELIARKKSSQMLYQASELLSDLAGVFAVVIILMRLNTDKQIEVKETEVYTNRHEYLEKRREFSLDSKGREVFKERDGSSFTRSEITEISNDQVGCALCLPLRGNSESDALGVMWFHFAADGPDKTQIDGDKAVYQLFANQVGLAYENVLQRERSEEKLVASQRDFVSKIDEDYDTARSQSRQYFIISLGTSILGVLLLSLMIASGQQSPIFTVLGIGAGILGQIASIFVFNIASQSHKRMDAYHEELFRLKQLDILLLSSQELGQGMQDDTKRKILEQAAQKAFDIKTKAAPSDVSDVPSN